MAAHRYLKTRVLAGMLKGRVLSYPDDRRLRPTMQRTRDSVFESLGGRVADAVFIDLYAAAGGVGIEALSRGAREVHFVENDRTALQCLRENLTACPIQPDSGIVHSQAVMDFLMSGGVRDIEPDIIFADPPYAADETRLLLEFFAGIDYPLKALLILEHHKDVGADELIENLGRIKFKKFGQSCLSYIDLTGGDA
jgi:16S rRNA (guanine966-N2)-methyltransferase